MRLGLAGASTTDSKDPGSWVDTFTFVGFSAVYNTLTEIAVDGTAIPELAESWTSTPDARVWTFKLRQGVTFHNGKTLTADDVVASIQHHLGEKSTSAAKTVLGDVAKVSANGSDSVVFELQSGNADFSYVVADYHLVIMPSKDGVPDWQAGVGTGGYRLKDFEPGVRMTLERSPDYWKAGRAHFASAELIAIADGAARINALVTGQVDVINKVDLKTVALLKRNPNLVIEETKGAQHYTFPMLTDSQVFQNNDVRLAMKHAINRETLLASVLYGYGLVGNDHPIQPGSRFINTALEQRTYDPDKARFLPEPGRPRFAQGPSASLRRGVHRRGGCLGAVQGAGACGRDRHRCGARAGGWFLLQRLDEATVHHLVLVQQPDRRPHVQHRLRQGRGVERNPLGQPAFQPTAQRRPGRDERPAAPRDVQRNAGAVPR